jgi:UDP-N-acetylmuramyl pentapeptide phosphotransferase/UDP-N-acetylglucosamine-1-phosphate transferase
MSYFVLIIIVSFVLMQVYLKLALKYNIIDKPNQRSSHIEPTVRGGGLIFVVISWFHYLFLGADVYLIIGSSLAAITAFIDDIKPLHQLPRLFAHFLGLSIVFLGFGYAQIPIIYWVLIFIFVTGWVNAYNFMDGINGISFIYALVALLFFYQFPELNSFSEFIQTLSLALLVFGFYNYRKKARVFAGDVGSVFLAFVLGFFMFQLIFTTLNFGLILMFVVYGLDAVITILFRLSRGENIFLPHRTHLYQYLVNELKMSHLTVSLLYGLIQLLINILVIYLYNNGLLSILNFCILLVIFALLYLILRFMVLKKVKV